MVEIPLPNNNQSKDNCLEENRDREDQETITRKQMIRDLQNRKKIKALKKLEDRLKKQKKEDSDTEKWIQALIKAQERGDTECPICMNDLDFNTHVHNNNLNNNNNLNENNKKE